MSTMDIILIGWFLTALAVVMLQWQIFLTARTQRLLAEAQSATLDRVNSAIQRQEGLQHQILGLNAQVANLSEMVDQ